MKITIGENIKALRIKKGITQEELSEVLGVTCAAVSKWERGETYPDITLIFPIAYYFGVSVDELMGYNREKVGEDIASIIGEYWALYAKKEYAKASELIKRAYREYPDDYEIMNRYMWDIGVDRTEPDLTAALANKDELTKIADRIIGGCTDGMIRVGAWRMKAIILHAEGKTDEALAIHSEKLSSWWESFEQANEQLFKKDTPEFLYWARRNMYELAYFAADKISKSIFFDSSADAEKRVADVEACGDALAKAYEATDNAVFVYMAQGLFQRLANDIKYRGIGIKSDYARVKEKSDKYWLTVNRLFDTDRPLCDAYYGNI